MKIKNYNTWLAESIEWNDSEFATQSEKEVADVAEQELLTRELLIIEETDKVLFDKLSQLASTDDGEKVLEISGHLLTKFISPIEFIRWDRLGSEADVIEASYIIKCEDESKI